MSTSLEQLVEQARALPAEDRAKLAESLLESLQPSVSEIEAAWTQEIERRIAAFDRGEIDTYSAEDVFADARRIAR
jgi:putative addiction module component (TIGR02574 family)